MSNNEFGDFQTPLELARECVQLLAVPAGARILEPTCGRGSFLQAAAEVSPGSERLGFEINESYVEVASAFGDVRQADFFQLDLHSVEWRSDGPLFIVGNPPWVTAAELKRMGSGNIPPKTNFKHAAGYVALLGSSNFDVCEYVILKLLSEFRSKRFTLSMLCKTQVARNVIEFAAKDHLPVFDASIRRIDAKHWFNAMVDACLFTVSNDPSVTPVYEADVLSTLDPSCPVDSRFGVVDGQLVSDVGKFSVNRGGYGKCPFEWRSGLKHDASKVFELKRLDSGHAESSFGDVFDVDGRFVLPLLKSTDVYRGKQSSRFVLVPQLSFGGETETLRRERPDLWSYLDSHSDLIDSRKSSIYRGKARFTVFGHGDYTYAPFKVAISGLHKSLQFRLITPIDGAPVVLDDTCYFLPFWDLAEACVVMALLESPGCQQLIESLVFWDSKRPVTKKLLSRVDMFSVPFSVDDVVARACELASAHGGSLDSSLVVEILDRHAPATTLI